MSGAPKRSHEEGGAQSSSASKYPHEDTANYPKMPSSSVPTEYHHPAPYDMGQDARMPRIPRTELRDSGRRSPLQHSMEFYAEAAKREYQSGKGEKDGRFESRGDESKELKHDRDNYSGPKSDLKVEKDLYGGASIHSSWKDPRDYLRGKRYSEPPGGNIDPWHIQRANSQGTVEVVKEGPATEERDYAEGHEAVGENKFDSKGDDRFKDKDRKRKDGKHRDWGDRDKERSDRRNNTHVGNSCGEDLKEKERPKEREKDHIKREPLNGAEKEGLNNEKELGDGSVRIQEQENQASEQKKQKELDSWKNMVKGLRKGKRKVLILESSSVKGCFVQEAALKWLAVSLLLDPDLKTTKGKPEVSTVVYKVGECMQELIKLWKEYEASQADKNGESSQNGPTLEIQIPAEHVTATNRQVRGGQLWGTDIYTDDSDLVAVLMHTGYCRPTASPPPPAIQELRATIRVLPPQDAAKKQDSKEKQGAICANLPYLRRKMKTTEKERVKTTGNSF
ncbi:hypothetical protein GOBAR_AA36422 [Gossypium barbadense]|uniref:Uncharacterized protein n=1 Tax=Gossypium barbadense TaxID=3634 RepID=A0A2P5VZN0_GOSBA|nr:hypothetical protein GOBAR_AA36422 [Gossypium barbadense]